MFTVICFVYFPDIEAEMYSDQKPALKKQSSKHIPAHDVSDTKSVEGEDKEVGYMLHSSFCGQL